MIVEVPNHAPRFYKKDGWTREIVSSCLRRGTIKTWPDDGEMQYWTIEPGSRFDMEKLLPLISELRGHNGVTIPQKHWEGFLE